MNLKKFKELARLKSVGDIKLPTTDEEYGLLIQESIENICFITIPIELVSTDTEHDVPLRFINGSSFIKTVNAPTTDTDEIIIDDRLSYAVLYDFLSLYLSDPTRAKRAEDKRDTVVSSYNWANQKLLDQLEQEEQEG